MVRMRFLVQRPNSTPSNDLNIVKGTLLDCDRVMDDSAYPAQNVREGHVLYFATTTVIDV